MQRTGQDHLWDSQQQQQQQEQRSMMNSGAACFLIGVPPGVNDAAVRENDAVASVGRCNTDLPQFAPGQRSFGALLPPPPAMALPMPYPSFPTVSTNALYQPPQPARGASLPTTLMYMPVSPPQPSQALLLHRSGDAVGGTRFGSWALPSQGAPSLEECPPPPPAPFPFVHPAPTVIPSSAEALYGIARTQPLPAPYSTWFAEMPMFVVAEKCANVPPPRSCVAPTAAPASSSSSSSSPMPPTTAAMPLAEAPLGTNASTSPNPNYALPESGTNSLHLRGMHATRATLPPPGVVAGTVARPYRGGRIDPQPPPLPAGRQAQRTVRLQHQHDDSGNPTRGTHVRIGRPECTVAGRWPTTWPTQRRSTTPLHARHSFKGALRDEPPRGKTRVAEAKDSEGAPQQGTSLGTTSTASAPDGKRSSAGGSNETSVRLGKAKNSGAGSKTKLAVSPLVLAPPAPQGLPYAEDPVEIDTTKCQLIVNYLPQHLTDEEFKDIFRPYGELDESASHIIFDFRHRKTVSKPSMQLQTDVTASSLLTLTNALSHSMEDVSSTSPSPTRGPCFIFDADMLSQSFSIASLSSEDDRRVRPLIEPQDAPASATVSSKAVGRGAPRSKGYGFIYYVDGASTERAIKELNGIEMGGKRLKVRYAEPQRPSVTNTAGDAHETK